MKADSREVPRCYTLQSRQSKGSGPMIRRASISGTIFKGLIAAPARAREAGGALSERNGRQETFAVRTRHWSENATLRGRSRSPGGPARRRTRRLDSSEAVHSSRDRFRREQSRRAESEA